MSLIVGLYVAKQFKLKRLDPSLSIDQKSRLLLRQTTVVLTIFNAGATFALLFALMGGSIWHFLGIIFIVLNFKSVNTQDSSCSFYSGLLMIYP